MPYLLGLSINIHRQTHERTLVGIIKILPPNDGHLILQDNT